MQVLRGRKEGEFVEHRLGRALARAGLSPPDRHLCQGLVYGVVRWQAALDWLIARKTDGRAQKPLIRELLRLGLYQIFWFERVPEHAAVNETVELARRHGGASRTGFVNALLRGYLREFAETKRLLEELKTAQPHLGYSHPEWLAARWQARWGTAPAAQLMDWNNTPAETFARVNTAKIDPDRLRARWREEGVEFEGVHRDWLENNLVFELKSHLPLEQLPSFAQGLFYVQDPSTLLAVRELAPRPGQTVLDLCAAPGGKLTYIAQLMGREGRLIAQDTSTERLKQLQENCLRLGIDWVQAAWPGANPASESQAQMQAATTFALPQPSMFDGVLIDAPCSNSGVMRRRVDLRWRIRPEELKRLRAMQLDLLRQSAPLAKPGCILVYSTCSLEPEENQEVVQEFLRATPGFVLESERQLLPFVDQVDGAYVARLKKGRS